MTITEPNFMDYLGNPMTEEQVRQSWLEHCQKMRLNGHPLHPALQRSTLGTAIDAVSRIESTPVTDGDEWAKNLSEDLSKFTD